MKFNNSSVLHALAALALLLLPSMASGYVITGQIADSLNTPVRKALILGKNSSNEVRVGIESDQNGRFASANVNDSILSIEISKEGYNPVHMVVSGTSDAYVDLGTIHLGAAAVMLNEVTVTAQQVTQKADRYIIIPTRSEIEQSTNGLSLLNNIQFKMPGLTVVEALQTVTVDNKTPVFKINGKPSDLTHFLSVNPDNVLRIEYHDSPDIRYNNRQIINIILKPRDDGGYVIGGLSNAFSTGFINGNAGANYHYNKSEFDLSYRVNWRDYGKRYINSDERFISPSATIQRISAGIPSDFNYLTHDVSLGYTYAHDANTVFSINAGAIFDNKNYDDDSRNTEIAGDALKKFTRLLKRKTDYASPSVDLFFRKQIDNTQSVEINAFGSYSTGNFDRVNSDVYENPTLDEHWTNLTKNNAWRGGAEVMYSKSFGQNLATNFGIKDYYNSTDNSQTNNTDLSEERIGQNYATVYAQLYGRIKRFNYGVNVAYQNNHSNNDDYIVNASRFKTNITMNYVVSRFVTLNYLFMYDPAMPSISQQSDLVQTIDGISIRQGNPDLKPSQYFRNRIYVRYVNRKLNTSLWISHGRTSSPIYYDYSYINNPASPYNGKFLSKPINGQHDDLLNFEWFLTLDRLFGHLTIWGKAGWDYHRLDLHGRTYDRKHLYGSINASFNWDNWVVYVNYQIEPRYNLGGNTFTSEDRWNAIGVQYRYKNWHFSLSGNNMFTRRGSIYKSITISDVHPVTVEQSIRDNANMVVLGINYRLDFGKRGNKTKRSIRNSGIEQGVDINY